MRRQHLFYNNSVDVLSIQLMLQYRLTLTLPLTLIPYW